MLSRLRMPGPIFTSSDAPPSKRSSSGAETVSDPVYAEGARVGHLDAVEIGGCARRVDDGRAVRDEVALQLKRREGRVRAAGRGERAIREGDRAKRGVGAGEPGHWGRRGRCRR